jgi:hypothetical protein
MTVRRSILTRLLLVGFAASATAVATPVLAAPYGGAYLVATAPLYAPRPPVARRAPSFRRVAYTPDAADAADGPYETAAAPSHRADVLPSRYEDTDQPDVTLAPKTAHYDYGPTGLTDDPTTFGLVAKF